MNNGFQNKAVSLIIILQFILIIYFIEIFFVSSKEKTFSLIS